MLNSLEKQLAEIEHSPSCQIKLTPLSNEQWGGYNPVTKNIIINSFYAWQSDLATYHEVIDTLLHEGRHAYQDYNIFVLEVHPRHSKVESWAETMHGGKWEY